MEKEISINKSILIRKKFIQSFIAFGLGQFLLIFATFLDSIISGNFLNMDAVKAVQIITPINTFTYFISNLAAFGVASKYFFLLNKGEKDRAHKLVGTSLIVTTLLGLVTALVFYLIKDPFINLFNPTEQVLKYAQDYYFWFIILVIFFPAYQMISQLVFLDFDVALKMTSDLTQCGLKIILSFILIRYLGTYGLGVATVGSFLISFIILGGHFFRKKNSIRFSFKPNFKDTISSIRLSLGTALAFFAEALSGFILNIFVVRTFGSDYLVILTIMSFVLNLGGIIRRIPSSLSPMVTMAYSTKNKSDYDYCIHLLKKSILIIVPIFTLIICGLSPVFPLIYKIQFSSNLYVYSVVTVVAVAISYIFTTSTRSICQFYTSVQIPSLYTISEIVRFFVVTGVTVLFGKFTGLIGLIIAYGASYGLVTLIIALPLYFKNKPHMVLKPLIVDESQFSIDILLSEENIKRAMPMIEERMSSYNLPKNLTKTIVLEIEETISLILKYNPNQKVVNRLTICIGKDEIRLLNKNNGRLIPQEEKDRELENKENHPHFNILYERSEFAMYGASTFNCSFLNIPLKINL